MVKKRIKLLVNTPGTIVVVVSNKGIEIANDNVKFNVSWEEVSNVIINKLTISFIPIDSKKPFITIDVKYKNEIVSTIKELKKEDLLVDNEVKL